MEDHKSLFNGGTDVKSVLVDLIDLEQLIWEAPVKKEDILKWVK